MPELPDLVVYVEALSARILGQTLKKVRLARPFLLRAAPARRVDQLEDAEIAGLYVSARAVLLEWIARNREEAGAGFPERVTAFRPGMAVHGRYGEPCPACGTAVQRIVYAENEANYCPRCQTGGKLLADRALSRILRGDWPRTVDDLEARRP